MKKIVILLFLSIFNFGKSQYVGVNNQNPNVALDVKGDLRVRSLETASSFSLSDNFVLSDTNNKLKTVKFNDLNLPQVSKIGTVMSVINNKLDIAPEVVVQATANQTTNGVGNPVILNVLNKELVDNYNAYSNGVFTCPVSGFIWSSYVIKQLLLTLLIILLITLWEFGMTSPIVGLQELMTPTWESIQPMLLKLLNL